MQNGSGSGTARYSHGQIYEIIPPARRGHSHEAAEVVGVVVAARSPCNDAEGPGVLDRRGHQERKFKRIDCRFNLTVRERETEGCITMALALPCAEDVSACSGSHAQRGACKRRYGKPVQRSSGKQIPEYDCIAQISNVPPPRPSQVRAT